MKPHTTVTITRKMLKDRQACESGIWAVRKLLPAKISTDPEANIGLALALAEVCGNASWFVKEFGFSWCMCPACNEWAHPDEGYGDDDPYIVAQWLAWTADKMASARGR